MKKMGKIISLIIISILLVSCVGNIQKKDLKQSQIPIIGTWRLISGTTIEKDDTTTTLYSKNLSFIKIINETHFAFLQHDLNKGKDSSAVFVAGGGNYSLDGSSYTEHLEYCNDRQWEGNDFKFTITIRNDTLVQSGIEKVESIGVNRINIEKYIRLKN
jgi:hypothetical protein